MNKIQYSDSIWSYIRSNEFGFHIKNTYGLGGSDSRYVLESDISKLWNIGNKMERYNPAEYALILFDSQIMVHLRKKDEIMSDELVHASFKESTSPITYTLISLIIIIIIGIILWLFMINIVFDKKKNILTNEEIEDFHMISLELKVVEGKLKKLSEEYNRLDKDHLKESILVEQNLTTLLKKIKEKRT